MPNIRQYVAPAGDALRPTGLGEEAAQRAAYRIGAGYDEAGQRIGSGLSRLGMAADTIEKHITQNEISQGLAAGAKLADALHDQWNTAAKGTDPNDATVGPKFENTVGQPAWDKFVQSFDTRAGRLWATRYATEMQQHLHEVIVGDQSARAGAAVEANYTAYGNNTATAVYNDPSSVDVQLANVDHSIQALAASSPNLSPRDQAKIVEEGSTKVKEMIATSALKAIADKNPALARQFLANPKYAPLLNGAQAGSYINQAERIQTAEARANMYASRLQAEITSQNAANDILHRYLKPGPNNTMIVQPGFSQALLNTPGLQPAQITGLTSWAAEANRQAAEPTPVRTDPDTFRTLMGQALDPATANGTGGLTTSSVMFAVANRKLNAVDGRNLLGLIRAEQTDPTIQQGLRNLALFQSHEQRAFMTANTANPYGVTTYARTPEGDHNYAQWVLNSQVLFARGIAHGIPWQQLLDPKDPNYVGQDESQFTGGLPVTAVPGTAQPAGGAGGAGGAGAPTGRPPPAVPPGHAADLQFLKANGFPIGP